jgi:hypothetical protein
VHTYLGMYDGSDIVIYQRVIVNKLALPLSLGSSSNNYDRVSKYVKNTVTLSLNLFSSNRNLQFSILYRPIYRIIRMHSQRVLWFLCYPQWNYSSPSNYREGISSHAQQYLDSGLGPIGLDRNNGCARRKRQHTICCSHFTLTVTIWLLLVLCLCVFTVSFWILT